MAAASPDSLGRLPLDCCQPTTFLERGVSLPCTTPLLLGARLRPAARGGFELLIANPGGRQGVYVVPWPSLPDICAPTLHDLRLWKVLSEQAVLTPAAVREAARAVAAEGYAGRGASGAAQEAAAAAAAERARVKYLLQLRVIRQMEAGPPPAEGDSPERVEARAQAALARLAEQAECSPEELAAGLEELAAILQDLGLPGDAQPGPLRRLAARVRSLAEDMAAYFARTPAAQELRIAEVIAQATGLTLRCFDATLAQIDARTEDVAALLRAGREERAALRGLAARPDWLLDGWAAICALWTDAAAGERLAAAREIALLLPLIPREAGAWTGLQADWERTTSLRRRVRALEDWRTGHRVDLTARNERLLVLAA